MSASVLVGYATRYGSTQEVAEAVAATLRERGLAVDLELMRDVRTLDQYRAVVLGAPLYMFHWHKDALHFLARHREALTQRPVAIFALGPFHAEEKEFQEVRRQLDQELAKFPWLIPQAIAIFGGKFDPEKLHFPYNLVPALKNMPAEVLPESSGAHGERTAEQPPAQQLRQMVDICVCDHGLGIPPDQLERIFERFHRVDTRLTREVNGLGLGLTICKHIVKLHHGFIWAESCPSGGSAVHVVLPVEGGETNPAPHGRREYSKRSMNYAYQENDDRDC